MAGFALPRALISAIASLTVIVSLAAVLPARAETSPAPESWSHIGECLWLLVHDPAKHTALCEPGRNALPLPPVSSGDGPDGKVPSCCPCASEAVPGFGSKPLSISAEIPDWLHSVIGKEILMACCPCGA